MTRDPDKPLTAREVKESFEPTAEERKRADELLEELYRPATDATKDEMNRLGIEHEPPDTAVD